MKRSIIFVFFLCASGIPSFASPSNIFPDTSIINHSLDGSINEWPASKFEADDGYGIRYAIDNDKDNLYIAMVVPDFKLQLKMAAAGMDLFIDMKEKRKEGRGIEFPIKRPDDALVGSFGNRQGDQSNNNRQRESAIKAFHTQMVLTFVSMKIFGFDDKENKEQGLKMPKTADIAFAWDSTNAMYIEYSIPLSMLEKNTASLNDKAVSVGWKIKKMEFKNPNSSGEEGSENSGENTQNSGGGYSGGGYRGGGGGGHRGGGGNWRNGGGSGQSGQSNMEMMMNDQNIWTRYTLKGIQ